MLEKNSLLKSSDFIKSINNLYGKTCDTDKLAERYSNLSKGLNGKLYLFSSPGRAELIGNHTDHNHGLVLATSIDMDNAACVEKTDDNFVYICSQGFEPFTVDINKLEIDKKKYGTSEALLKGVLKGFIDRKYKVGGFKANIDSNIFKGAGVSSSAAFELLLCEILNVLYNDGQIDYITKAIISRYAENVYFGKPSGLMDQLTISRGGVSFMNFKHRIPKSKSAPWTLDNVSLIIINCGGDHCNLTDEYASIREDMNNISHYFGKKVLADVKEEDFYNNITDIKTKFTGRAILRAMHFFDENKRVKDAVKALNKGSEKKFLKLICESGYSSYMLLQNCFPTGDKEQPVTLALGIVSHNEKTLAYRVHGGGFAGTILCFVNDADSNDYVADMKKIFGNENVFKVKSRDYGAIELKY
ncbi:MAG: galactokinase [Clostridia bacterium]|nr:galactokinase [Clostridia bacterium]